MKNRLWKLILLVLVGLVVWLLWANRALEQTTYSISSEKLPDAFEGFRIVHISDLHNTEFGQDNEKLLKMVAVAKPDLIAITGDVIDSRRTDMDIAFRFVQEAAKIAPCYYVTGNHESRLDDYDRLKDGLQERGVVILEDGSVNMERDGAVIRVLGVDDPAFVPVYSPEEISALMDVKLRNIQPDNEIFTILLSHRPELFDVYVQHGLNLVLTGHAHGGQVRMPWIGGLYMPGQGLFPEYDAGMFVENGTTMIISRGLGNSAFPLRVNNRPEVVVIELHSTTK